MNTQQEISIDLKGNQLVLSALKLIYWPSEQSILCSDTHFGKSGHFRKNGLPVPTNIGLHDFALLSQAIEKYPTKKLVIIGDMFHSKANAELALFTHWRKQHSELNIVLIKGNHDILPRAFYKSMGIQLIEKSLLIQNLLLCHEPPAEPCHYYAICGHVHPAFKIKTKGRQHLTFPCFALENDYAILPAFSQFSGHHILKLNKKTKYFGLYDDNIFELNPNLSS